MLNYLEPDRYYDEPYRNGTNVVLLALRGDDLTTSAVRVLERVSELTPSFRFWVVEIVSARDAEAVQAIRFPQYRFIHNGDERHDHVGLLEDEELLEAFDHLEC